MDSRISSNCRCTAYEARIPDVSNSTVGDLAKSVKGDYLLSDVRCRGARRPRPSKDPPTDVLYLGREKTQPVTCDCPCRLYHRIPNMQAAARGRSLDLDTTMAEEYCLDDGALDLAPYYSSNNSGGSSSSTSSRRFVNSTSKLALKTVSIMETLSELAGSSSGSVQRQMRRLGVPDPPLSSVKSSMQDQSVRSQVNYEAHHWTRPKVPHVNVARKLGHNTCTGVENVSALRGPSTSSSSRISRDRDTTFTTTTPPTTSVTSVTRMNGQTMGLQWAGRRGRSAEDILSVAEHSATSGSYGLAGTSISTAALSEGFRYGSLERQCRRKTSYASARRRGETDWEREPDEEENEEDLPVMESKSLRWASAEKKLRERGQTPDWIRQVFQVVRLGDVESLRLAVEGMESTLVRNLSDHTGNNLWHVLSNYGHEAALAWLCSHVGAQQSKPALLDQNKRGLTPVVLAIKAGHVGVVQFLVNQTAMGVHELLAPQEGERCLLHVAAKYGQVEILQWLLEVMTAKGLELEPRDRCGHTALHLAAKNGHASAAALLVAHGADVTAKNDMGHRPMDVATKQGHVGVAQLLRLQEAALALSGDFTNVSHELDSLRADHAELKSYFRDVLGVAKRMSKERDEMCREWSHFYDDLTSSHQAILLEMRANERRGPPEDNRGEGEVLIEALHERWQTQSRAWFSGSLSEYEHRLLLVEEGWKRLRVGHSKSRQSASAAQELLRNRLASLGGSSIQSYEVVDFSSPSDNPSRDSESESDESPHLSKTLPLLQEKSAKETLLSSENLYGSFHAAMHASTPSATPNRHVENVRVTGNMNTLRSSTRESRQSKAEMRQKLQEVKLVSESGNASVLEVIEPTSSSSSCCDEEELAAPLFPEHQSTPKAKAVAIASVVALLPAPRESTLTSNEPEEVPGRLAEPDLLAGTVRDAQAAEEPSSLEENVVVYAEDVADEQVQAHEEDEEREEDSEGEMAAHEIYSDGGYQSATVTESQLSVRPESPTSFLSTHSHKKKTGFLTKFALKSRWPSKRKPKLDPSSPPNPTGSSKASDEATNSSPGRVAGLSQMFEDLGTNTASSSHVPPPLPPREPLTSSHADTQTLLQKLEIKSSSASSTSHGMESVSVGTSEDSGIVVMRPMSAASRPESSSSASAAFPPFHGRILHHKTQELNDRLSPAPSELSKAESASSPPSEMSKSDSARHMRHLARIEEAAASNGSNLCNSHGKAPPPPPVKPKSLLKEGGKTLAAAAEAEKTETTWREAKLREQLNPAVMSHQHGSLLKIQRVRLEEYHRNSGGGRSLRSRHSERPWYDVSDDESDLLTPERLTQLTARSSSDDDIGLQV